MGTNNSFRLRLLPCRLFAGIFLLLAAAAFAFRIEIPEDVAKLPQAEQDKYVNTILDDAKVEQERLAAERHEERLQDQEALSNEMVKRAEERRQLILEARKEREREEAETAHRSKVVFFFSLIILIPAVTIFIYMKKKETAGEVSDFFQKGHSKP